MLMEVRERAEESSPYAARELSLVTPPAKLCFVDMVSKVLIH